MKKFIINSVLAGTIGVFSFGNVTNVSAETVQVAEKYELVEGATDISKRAIFSIAGVELEPGTGVSYDSPFYITSKDVLSYNAAWVPAGQGIRLSLFNIYTEKWTDFPMLSGGTATGTVSMPSGFESSDYLVYLRASENNVVNIGIANVALEWK